MKITLSILTITLTLQLSAPTVGEMPADALQRVGWAFDGHSADGRIYPSDSLGRYDLHQLYDDCVNGWWYDFGSDPRGGNDSQLDYKIHMLWSVPDRITIESIIRNNPGDVIVIGNEPDLSSQSNMQAARYAEFYHDAHALIREVDNHYPVAIGGVSNVSDYTLSYLADVLDTYQSKYSQPMAIDVWTVHAYAEIPTSLEAVQRQVMAMRAFMAQRGYQDRPLWLTEFNTTPEQMAVIYDWLLTAQSDNGMPEDEYRLVQRFAHFALNSYREWDNYAFDKVSAQPTEYAEAFSEWAKQFECEWNFLPSVIG